MKRIPRVLFTLSFLAGFYGSCVTAQAAGFDFNVNSDALRFTLSKTMAPQQVGDIGLLSVDRGKRHDSENVLHLGYHWLGNNFRFGLRSIYSSPGDYDILALGLGFQGQTAISRNVYLGGHFYYAPSAFSFMDGDGYDEFALRVMLQIGRSAFAYIGYRNFNLRLSPYRDKLELDDDFHIGFRLFF